MANWVVPAIGAAGTVYLGLGLYRRCSKVAKVPTSMRKTLSQKIVLFLIAWERAAPIPIGRIVTRFLSRLALRSLPKNIAVSHQEAKDVPLIVFERKESVLIPNKPAIVWMHGGGLVKGDAAFDAITIGKILEHIDAIVFSVEYRLAPEYPYPAAIDDCAAALRWVVSNAHVLGVDPTKIILGGESAGGGLTAALAQRARDEKIVEPIFQILIYPMLDDRTNLKSDHGDRGQLLWTPHDNKEGWTSYRCKDASEDENRPWCVPGRCEDLSGLPPAWIGVGTLDLFYHEDVDYADRLRKSGVECVLDVSDGGYHGFDQVSAGSEEVKSFHRSLFGTLDKVLAAASDPAPTAPATNNQF